MKNLHKEEIKRLFLEINEELNKSSELKDEIKTVLRFQAAVNSCSLESEKISPLFLQLFPSVEYSRKWEKVLPEYYYLQLEMQGYLATLKKLESYLIDDLEITTDFLLELHRDIFLRSRYGLAGKFRDNDDESSINGHKLPHHSMLPEQIDQHLSWLKERQALIGQVSENNFFEIFHIASEAHFRFVESAPFNYGNGIIARMMADYTLLSSGLFYNVIYFDDFKKYFTALKQSSMNDFSPLTEFTIKSYAKTLHYLEGFVELHKSSTEQIYLKI